MPESKISTPVLLDIRVELFGRARMAAGHRQVQVAVPNRARIEDLVSELSRMCPALVGEIIIDDLSGLQPSYTLNINGTSFVGDGPLELEHGDTVLLFSSQAGG